MNSFRPLTERPQKFPAVPLRKKEWTPYPLSTFITSTPSWTRPVNQYRTMVTRLCHGESGYSAFFFSCLINLTHFPMDVNPFFQKIQFHKNRFHPSIRPATPLLKCPPALLTLPPLRGHRGVQEALPGNRLVKYHRADANQAADDEPDEIECRRQD